jgi:hypothetical protein
VTPAKKIIAPVFDHVAKRVADDAWEDGFRHAGVLDARTCLEIALGQVARWAFYQDEDIAAERVKIVVRQATEILIARANKN